MLDPGLRRGDALGIGIVCALSAGRLKCALRIGGKVVRFKTIGRGVYSLSEATVLTGVNRHRIRRWTLGYRFNYRGVTQTMPPIIGQELLGDGLPMLSFADLIEIRFLDAFRRHGVSSKALRIAAQRAKELLGRHHPFSTQIFRSDGRTVLAEITQEAGDKTLLDIVSDQYVFEKVIDPYLYSGLEFNEAKEPTRWWPLGRHRSIVIDPQRSFGAPILARTGLPTKIVSKAVNAEQPADFVAKWYDLRLEEVQDALEFETKLAA